MWRGTKAPTPLEALCSRRSGYLESAQALASDRDMEDLVDLRLFSVAHSVARQLEARDCRAALEFCAQNRARLKKNNSRLEFRLR